MKRVFPPELKERKQNTNERICKHLSGSTLNINTKSVMVKGVLAHHEESLSSRAKRRKRKRKTYK